MRQFSQRKERGLVFLPIVCLILSGMLAYLLAVQEAQEALLSACSPVDSDTSTGN